jgi:hypothetical protein
VLSSEVDVEKARQEHRASMRSTGKSLLWFASSLLLLGILTALGPGRELIEKLGGKPEFSDTICVAMFFFSVVAYAASAYAFHSAQAIPNEPPESPAPFDMITDQPWRKPTGLRFLEKLKEKVTRVEERIRNVHEVGVDAHQSISRVISISDYHAAIGVLHAMEAEKAKLLSELPLSYERIERIFNGDVGKEILDIKEQTKKLERQKQEDSRKLATWETACTIQHKNKDEMEECDQKRLSHREYFHKSIHLIDVELIELETDLEELHHFDFHQLWTALDLPGPPNLTRVAKEAIEDLKGKVDSLNTISGLTSRGPQPAPPIPPSKEETRLKNKARCEADIERLRVEREAKVQTAKTPTEARRWENFYDDAIREAEDEWKKHLR